MAISGTNKDKTGYSSQHPGSPVQRPCGPTLNIFHNNQPEDWEKEVKDSQHLPFTSSPDCTPKKVHKKIPMQIQTPTHFHSSSYMTERLKSRRSFLYLALKSHNKIFSLKFNFDQSTVVG